MWAEEELFENQRHNAPTSGPLSILSLPKATNEWVALPGAEQGFLD